MDGDAPAESRIEDSMALRQYTYAGRPFGDDWSVAEMECKRPAKAVLKRDQATWSFARRS